MRRSGGPVAVEVAVHHCLTDVDDGGEAEEVKGDLPILSLYD